MNLTELMFALQDCADEPTTNRRYANACEAAADLLPNLYRALDLLFETVEAGEDTEAALNIARGALKEVGGAS